MICFQISEQASIATSNMLQMTPVQTIHTISAAESLTLRLHTWALCIHGQVGCADKQSQSSTEEITGYSYFWVSNTEVYCLNVAVDLSISIFDSSTLLILVAELFW